MSDLKTDVAWIKEMLSNHLRYHERFTVALFVMLISTIVAAGTGIVSLIIAISQKGK